MQLSINASILPEALNNLDPECLSRKKIGAKIRQIREDKGWTQERLAEKLDKLLSEDAIGLIERGLRDVKVSQLRAIARALNVAVSEFIESHQYYVVYECLDAQGNCLKKGDVELNASERILSISPIKDFIRENLCLEAEAIFIYNVQPPIGQKE